MEKVAHVAAFGQGAANEGGAYLEDGSRTEADGGGKRGGVDRVSGTGVDDDTMAGKDELGLVPAGKQLPVVRAYYQMEAAAGVEALQGIKGVQGVEARKRG